jgi:hypothetical protein
MPNGISQNISIIRARIRRCAHELQHRAEALSQITDDIFDFILSAALLQ